MDFIKNIYLSIGLWCISKLFNKVAFYSDENENIRVIHFATDKEYLDKSIKELAGNL